ncbi:spore germination protein [Mesobacillus boroniphilus JCM 21738]|uniref:Spore germination protein n=1 Tax=Mesobacillus boroniphilus JCM 21738 TaxID=1294265 RepID=W4RLS8_9BACI|nr:GerAB/ArcD/ProY family transporter [Mesobacillus boroniphilus]GAE44843.1 spore germination protein [Mesobacillus boroniphilus JCM 21738]
MKIYIEPKPQNMVNSFLLIFVIHSMQVGVGIQGFQRIIYLETRHDAWISVIISGVATAILGFIMVKTLSYMRIRIYLESNMMCLESG